MQMYYFYMGILQIKSFLKLTSPEASRWGYPLVTCHAPFIEVLREELASFIFM